MDFHLDLQPEPLSKNIQMRDSIMLAGSCFTEHMTEKLRYHKFRALENPHGILFNPVSLSQSVNDCIGNRKIDSSELFEDKGLWCHWSFHSRYSHADRESAIKAMNQNISAGHKFLKSAQWLILTLGSAFVYELNDHRIVANCHKAPASRFVKRLLAIEEVLVALEEMVYKLNIFNPDLNIIFTVSPVRHVRDGLVENNRSKAVLLQAVHHLVEKFPRLHYFPAYELVIDDLRDYRFYAEDMVHPNYQATAYVWQKFAESCIAPETREVMKEIGRLTAARLHKPQHPESVNHQVFMKKALTQTFELSGRFPYLDFTSEIEYFSGKAGSHG